MTSLRKNLSSLHLTLRNDPPPLGVSLQGPERTFSYVFFPSQGKKSPASPFSSGRLFSLSPLDRTLFVGFFHERNFSGGFLRLSPPPPVSFTLTSIPFLRESLFSYSPFFNDEGSPLRIFLLWLSGHAVSPRRRPLLPTLRESFLSSPLTGDSLSLKISPSRHRPPCSPAGSLPFFSSAFPKHSFKPFFPSQALGRHYTTRFFFSRAPWQPILFPIFKLRAEPAPPPLKSMNLAPHLCFSFSRHISSRFPCTRRRFPFFLFPAIFPTSAGMLPPSTTLFRSGPTSPGSGRTSCP